MKTKIKISKLLQIGLLLTLFLPFFPQGCKQKQAVEAPDIDTTAIIVDTLAHDSILLTQQNIQSDTTKAAIYENSTQSTNKTEVEEEGNGLSTKISKKSTILKLLLRPNNNYTGIASLIDFFSVLEVGYGLGIAFILWLIALIVKLKDYNNIFIIMNTVGLGLMYGSHYILSFSDKRLWGFWVCIVWCAIMILYDLLILLKIRKETKKTCA